MRIREVEADARLEAVLETQRAISRGGTHDELFRQFAARAHRVLGFEYFLDVSSAGLPPGSYRIMDRGSLPLGGDDPRPENLWDSQGVPVGRGGALGELARGERPHFADALELSEDPELTPYSACLTVPVFRDGVVEEWILLFGTQGSPPASDDVAFAVMACNHISQAIVERKLLEEVERLHGDLRAKIDELARVQHSILPGAPPEVPGLTFAVSYAPCDAAGGDYYDFRVFPEGNVGAVIADVAGHGPAASVVMAMMRTVMGAYRRFGRPAETVVADVNDVLVESLEHGMFVTAFFCSIDPRTGDGFYANCGHNPPRVRRADGWIDALAGSASPPLGILPELEGQGDTFVLSPGDCLVLYTDGITEAFDAERRMFGEVRLDEVIAATDGSPARVVEAVVTAVADHEGGRPRADDQCVVVARYEGAAAATT